MDEDKEEFTSSGPQYDIEKLSSATAEQLSIKVEDQDENTALPGENPDHIEVSSHLKSSHVEIYSSCPESPHIKVSSSPSGSPHVEVSSSPSGSPYVKAPSSRHIDDKYQNFSQDKDTGVTDVQLVRYRSRQSINTRPSIDGSATLASALLADEAFNTVVYMSSLTPTQNYFDVEITAQGTNGIFAVGVGPRQYPLKSMPGWIEDSFGYHASGKVFIEQGDIPMKGPKCREGDRMGCGLDFSTAKDGFVKLWFTKNGRLACWPEKILYHPKLSLHPIITVGSSGEVIHYSKYSVQDSPDTETIYPWYNIVGFINISEIPFYSKEESILAYGLWKDQLPHHLQSTTRRMSWDELRDGLLNGIPEAFRMLGEMSPSTYAEWMELAYNALSRNEKFATTGKAPNGLQFGKNEQMALFIAQEALAALESLETGLNLKDVAIFAYLSLGLESQFLNITVVSGLLYMGCLPNSSIKRSHVFHNPDISVSLVHLLLNWGGNPNIPDAIGRTPLHIHQNNRALMRTFLDYNADVSALDDDKDTPLHIAGVHGRSGLATLLIENGASATESHGGQATPLDLTANAGYSDCFRHMFKLSVKSATEKEIQKQIIEDKWKAVVSGISTVKKIKMKELQELTKEELYYITVKQKEDDDDRYSVRMLISEAMHNDADLNEEFFTKILDCCQYGDNAVVTDILDADIHGNVSGAPTEGISLFTYLSNNPALLLPLVSHDTLKAYIADQWRNKTFKTFGMRFLFHVFQLILITFALAIAARPEVTDEQLNAYHTPIDIFRGVCESVVILLIMIKIFDEVVELVNVGVSEYVVDLTNYVQWLTITCVLTIVPLRVTAHPEQWVVVTILYFAYGLKLFYFVGLFSASGAFVQALFIIVSRDVVKFVAMFLIVLIIFGGSFYMALTYTAVTTSGQHENYLHDMYLIGLRTMIESGPVVDYYNDGIHYGLLSVILYLFFLFIVVIVLLNVLIAQVSDTYTKVLAKAEVYTHFYQCLYIARLERSHCTICKIRPLYFFLQKLKLCGIFCSNCCKHLVCGCCAQGRESLIPTERPRILWKSDKQENSKLKVQNVRRKFGQVLANYLPRTVEAEAEASTPDASLDMKLDTNLHNLKEWRQVLTSSLTQQHEDFLERVKNDHSTLVSEMHSKKEIIETDIQWSENQRTTIANIFFTELNEIGAAISMQLEQMKLTKAKERDSLVCLLSKVMQHQDRINEELFTQQAKLKEEISAQHIEIQREFARKDRELREPIAEYQKELDLRLLTQQEELKVLSRQQQEANDQLLDKQAKLNSKITKDQEDLRAQLAKQAQDMKEHIEDHQERLDAAISDQQEKLTVFSQQQDDFLSIYDDLEAKLSKQAHNVQQLLAEKQRYSMYKMSEQRKEIMKIASAAFSTTRRQYLSILES